jgi:hypothetical protein
MSKLGSPAIRGWISVTIAAAEAEQVGQACNPCVVEGYSCGEGSAISTITGQECATTPAQVRGRLRRGRYGPEPSHTPEQR